VAGILLTEWNAAYEAGRRAAFNGGHLWDNPFGEIRNPVHWGVWNQGFLRADVHKETAEFGLCWTKEGF
jgi:hypothetical protein